MTPSDTKKLRVFIYKDEFFYPAEKSFSAFSLHPSMMALLKPHVTLNSQPESRFPRFRYTHQ